MFSSQTSFNVSLFNNCVCLNKRLNSVGTDILFLSGHCYACSF